MTTQQIAMSFSMGESILSLGLITAAGYLAQRTGLFGDRGRQIMGEIMLKITFPCLGFHSMVTKVDPALFTQNLLAVGMGALILTTGLLCGYLAVLPVRLEHSSRNTFVHLVSACNYIFLPLPIVKALWPEQEGSMFLHSLGCGFAYWIVSIYPLCHGEKLSIRVKNTFNLPMIAMTLGLVIALLGGGEALAAGPARESSSADRLLHLLGAGVMQSLQLLGAATVPLALLFVGAALASATARTGRLLMLYYSLIRLILFPLLFLAVIKYSGLSGEAAYVPLLISMMPASNTSTVIAHRFGGDADMASAANLFSTPLALLTVPILFPILSALLDT